jgi:hypothetical protein
MPSPIRVLCVLELCAASCFVVPSVPSVFPRRSPTPAASAELGALLLALEGEAPAMADGSIFVAIGGGLLAIATAGIPILFLRDKDDGVDKLEGLEKGVGSLEEEVIEDEDLPPPSGDAPGKQGTV